MDVPAERSIPLDTPAADTSGVAPARPRPQPYDTPRPAGAFSPHYKSPIIAAMLSVAPGLGQVYIGYYVQGFVHILVVLSLILLGVSEILGDSTPAVGFFVAFFWLYNIIDAGRRAAFYNQAIRGDENFRLPGELPIAGPQGSLLLGGALLVAGGILLSNTALGWSLAWVEMWWPVAPMGIGAYLLVRGVMENK